MKRRPRTMVAKIDRRRTRNTKARYLSQSVTGQIEKRGRLEVQLKSNASGTPKRPWKATPRKDQNSTALREN